MSNNIEVFEKLYELVKNKTNPRTISPLIEAGEVAAIILTKNKNMYYGVCIDTASSLGMCAERNAIANMITNGESKIEKLVCCFSDGRLGFPCGACRELLMQLDKNSGEIEILESIKPFKTINLKDLIPYWWGNEFYK
jgi:cytidine deaminase